MVQLPPPVLRATVEVAPGDARLSLEREPPQHFDLLVLDAFSSDAIPVHLLTKEAFEVYRGISTPTASSPSIFPTITSTSNRWSSTSPATSATSWPSIDYEETDEEWWLYGSTWVLLTRNDQIINRPEIRNAANTVHTNSLPLWTDDFASLFQILR